MSGPDPVVAAVRSAVRAALRDLAPESLVLVACSGGTDSLALAAATAFEAPKLGLRAGAVVVDHAWFEASAQVAANAAQTCRDLGLNPVEVARLKARDIAAGPHGRRGQGGPEAAAREGRYEALQRLAVRYEAVAILLGHTLDDQAETVLLGLARGSGLRSSAGMAARRGLLRRPLLGITRAHTQEFCAAAGLSPWHDPANLDPAYARPRVRAALAALGEALGPQLVANLARTAELAREDADALDALAEQALAQHQGGGSSSGGSSSGGSSSGGSSSGIVAVLDCGLLAGTDTAVRRRVLLRTMRAAGCPGSALGRRQVLALDALVMAWHGQGPVHLPGGVVARRRYGRLVFRRGPDPDPGPDPDVEVDFESEPWADRDRQE